MESSSPPRHRTPSGPRPRLPRALIIEDSEECRDLFTYEFEAAGFVTSTAHDGVEALEAMKHFEPDVIVLDLILPHLSGFAVARAVRGLARSWRVAIVAVSGIQSQALRSEALLAGCDVILGKPVPPPMLVAQAFSLMARRNSGDASADR
jgi:DNA-binding response OmpR family regulator